MRHLPPRVERFRVEERLHDAARRRRDHRGHVELGWRHPVTTSVPAGGDGGGALSCYASVPDKGRSPTDGGGHLPGLLTATPARRALVLGAGARHHILHFRHQRRDVIRNAVLDCPTRCRRRASQRKRPLADPPARARSLTARPLTQRRLAHHHAPIMAPAEGLSSATGLVRHVPARYEAHLRRADGRAVTQEHRALFRSC